MIFVVKFYLQTLALLFTENVSDIHGAGSSSLLLGRPLFVLLASLVTSLCSSAPFASSSRPLALIFTHLQTKLTHRDTKYISDKTSEIHLFSTLLIKILVVCFVLCGRVWFGTW